MKRDIISVFDMKDDIQDILSLAAKLKSGEKYTPVLQGKTLALIFEKSSTRTRTSFEVGIYQLGGHSVHLNQHESQMAGEKQLRILQKSSAVLPTALHTVHSIIQMFALSLRMRPFL